VPQGAAPRCVCWDAPSYMRAGWLSCVGVCPLRVRSVCGLVTGALAWRLAEKVKKALECGERWRGHWGQVRRAAVWGLVAVSLQEAVEAATNSNPPWLILIPAAVLVAADGARCGQFAGSCGGSDQKQSAVAYAVSSRCDQGVVFGFGCARLGGIVCDVGRQLRVLLRSVCRKLWRQRPKAMRRGLY